MIAIQEAYKETEILPRESRGKRRDRRRSRLVTTGHGASTVAGTVANPLKPARLSVIGSAGLINKFVFIKLHELRTNEHGIRFGLVH